MTTERWIEGDSRERLNLDAAPWSLDKARKKIAKHLIWFLIAWWTGGAWVLYFADAPTLVHSLATLQAGSGEAYLWILILTFTTYVFAGVMREKLCLHACPWPRIQAALTDEYALNVTYRYDRGEPRMSLKQAKALRAQNLHAGDCVDCGQCVAVCPTGVDIRKGSQLGCIQCGLCIDACDAIMTKIHRPARLIGYDTDLNVKHRQCGAAETYKLFRPRTIIYLALILAIGGFMTLNLATRSDAHVSILHDRNPTAVRLKDGGTRNGYTARFSNMKNTPRKFTLEVIGVTNLHVDVIGEEKKIDGKILLEIGPDQTRETRILVATPQENEHKNQASLTFRLTDPDSNQIIDVKDSFIWP